MANSRELLLSKKPNLHLRARMLREVRLFFDLHGFLEVQTPVLTGAPAPEPYIEAVPAGRDAFLITSPELYMKRLLSAGYDKIYQITPAFRDGERGRLHLPEFTLLEWYRLNANYTALQHDCRNLFLFLSNALDGLARWHYRGTSLEIKGEWEVLTVREAFLRHAGWEPQADVEQEAFDSALLSKVEPRLGFPTPCILTDYPSGQAALSRLKPGDESVAERFELYWAGIELANGFSELTDPHEQRKRFESAAQLRKDRGMKSYPIPAAFLDSLGDLQPCAGIALGFDRLVMLAAGAHELDPVVAFTPELS